MACLSFVRPCRLEGDIYSAFIVRRLPASLCATASCAEEEQSTGYYRTTKRRILYFWSNKAQALCGGAQRKLIVHATTQFKEKQCTG